MRLITRATDKLLNAFVPKTAGKAGPYCEPSTSCNGCSNHRNYCCHTWSNCDRSCHYDAC